MKSVLFAANVENDIYDFLAANHNKTFTVTGFYVKPLYKEVCNRIDASLPVYGMEYHYNYNYSSFDIDNNLLSAFYGELGNDALFLLDRVLPAEENNSHLLRSIFLYTNLSYLGKVLDETKPDVVIFNTTPHNVLHLMLYWLAKRRGIKTVMAYFLVLGKRYYSYKFDYKTGDMRFREAYEYKLFNRNVNIELEETASYYKKLKGTYEEAIPEYEKKNKVVGYNFNPLRVTSKRLKDFSVILSMQWYRRKVLAYFKQHVSPITSEKYLLFGLQYQPERTSMPEADYYANAWLVLKLLSDNIPEDWKIYIKEHPSTFGRKKISSVMRRFRSIRFYESMLSIPKVKLIDAGDTFSLIDKSVAVVTLTGTIGIEALFRNKPVLSFGYSPYACCKGIFNIQNGDELRVAVQQIINGFTVDEYALKAFFKTTEEVFQYEKGKDTPLFKGYALAMQYLANRNFE